MRDIDEPLADWERELLLGRHDEGYGEVTLHIRDRFKPLVLDHIHIDDIAPGHGLQFAVLEMTDRDGVIFHIPNVDYYTIEYR